MSAYIAQHLIYTVKDETLARLYEESHYGIEIIYTICIYVCLVLIFVLSENVKNQHRKPSFDFFDTKYMFVDRRK